MRKLMSSDEAVTADHQHTSPCSDCPWRRDALNGWLGGTSVGEWRAAAHGETKVFCHTISNQQCAGIAIYRANVCKTPRDPTLLRLPADRDACFSTPTEFEEHHSAPLKGN